MISVREKLQALLRQLFQFESADLDFGIYRIMNYRRTEIERFIDNDLLNTVAAELDRGALSSQTESAAELVKVAAEIRRNLGADAITADGELAPQYHATPLGRRYLELRAQVGMRQTGPEHEAFIFNHLYAFFSRYYQDGDFISKRRYSSRERYVIPYNGEETYFYWANRDQYYVKNGEYFTDYTFKTASGETIYFKLMAADVEQGDVQGGARFFIPLLGSVDWNEKTRGLVLPFQYRPLTKQETITYGSRAQQDKIIAEVLQKIPARLKDQTHVLGAVMAERYQDAQGNPISCLEHHLRQYVRRNTSDFFIHKDLRGFLERELDFYLKNEILGLDEMFAGNERQAEAWFQLAQIIRRISLRIITFLGQIEDFQKRLWEKSKFVLSTDYCVTIDRVPKTLYPEIARNAAQIDEWRELLGIDGLARTPRRAGRKIKRSARERRNNGIDPALFEQYPTLVVDTRFFDQDFKDRLLASFGDLDKETAGLLFHADNFQALRLLLAAYRGKVKCTYIDPPYNTESSPIPYKNAYKDSSWATIVSDRIATA